MLPTTRRRARSSCSARVIRAEDLAGAPAVAESLAARLGLDATACEQLVATVGRLVGSDVTVHLRPSHPIEGGPYVEVVVLRGGSDSDLDFHLGSGGGEAWSGPGQPSITMTRHGGAARPRPTLGYVGVPYPGERVSGDGVWLHDRDTHLRLAVVDGLGHGKGAHAAMTAALAALEANRDRRLDATIASVHEALRETRGAAIGLGELDRTTRRFEWLGIGNIAGVICAPHGATRSIASHNGTLGQRVPRAPSVDYDWPAGACALFHSDGLGSSYHLNRYPHLERHHRRSWRRCSTAIGRVVAMTRRCSWCATASHAESRLLTHLRPSGSASELNRITVRARPISDLSALPPQSRRTKGDLVHERPWRPLLPAPGNDEDGQAPLLRCQDDRRRCAHRDARRLRVHREHQRRCLGQPLHRAIGASSGRSCARFS